VCTKDSACVRQHVRGALRTRSFNHDHFSPSDFGMCRCQPLSAKSLCAALGVWAMARARRSAGASTPDVNGCRADLHVDLETSSKNVDGFVCEDAGLQTPIVRDFHDASVWIWLPPSPRHRGLRFIPPALRPRCRSLRVPSGFRYISARVQSSTRSRVEPRPLRWALHPSSVSNVTTSLASEGIGADQALVKSELFASLPVADDRPDTLSAASAPRLTTIRPIPRGRGSAWNVQACHSSSS